MMGKIQVTVGFCLPALLASELTYSSDCPLKRRAQTQTNKWEGLGWLCSSTQHFSIREEHQALHLWGSLISGAILDGFPTHLYGDDSFYNHLMSWGKFLQPAHSLSHRCCLVLTLWCGFVCCIWLCRGIHIRSFFGRTSNSPAIWC